MPRTPLTIAILLFLAVGTWVGAQDLEEPPRGPFGLSMVTTVSGEKADIEDFHPNRTCSICHKTPRNEMRGSMHAATHTDPFYRAFAELAREEAGEEVYTYCSGCHAPSGVVSGLIPGTAEEELPREVLDGTSCDVCHQITALTGNEGPWGEPGNASVVLAPGGDVKFGPLSELDTTPAHDAEARDFFTSSEYCASCHTIIHPLNGLRIEHTYDEWKESIYAANDIHCQDCHMRSVEDAIKVARDLAPQPQPVAPWVRRGEPRPVSMHTFVGANVEAGLLAGGFEHAKLAEQRLKSAALLRLEPRATDDGTVSLDVVVENVGAGHNLPTSLTELREMWVEVRVTDAKGKVLHESGAVAPESDLPDHSGGLIRFGAQTVDAKGEITYKPWEAVGFAWKRLVPPKGFTRDEVRFTPPADAAGPFTAEARLLFRISPPSVVRMVMKEKAFVPQIVEMTSARVEIPR